jgi:hypothetical protein
MATLTVQTATNSGATLTFAAVAASDVFTNDGDTVALFDNGSGGNIVITATAAGTPGGLSLSDVVTANIATATIGVIGPFDPTYFNDSNGQVTLASDVTSSVTVAILKV